jgi:PAS domain S-box-containing protein
LFNELDDQGRDLLGKVLRARGTIFGFHPHYEPLQAIVKYTMHDELKVTGNPGDRILKEQVRFALEQVPTMQAASWVTSLVLCYAVRNVVSPVNILVWALLILLIVIGRAMLVYRFNRTKDNMFDGQVWRNIFLISALISGIIWGLSAFVIFPAGNAELIAFLVVVIASLSAGATVSHSPIKLGAIAWAGPALLPYAVRCGMEMTEWGTITSFLIVFYLFGILHYSFIHHNSITSGIALRFKNLELVDELRNANAQLRQDIVARKRAEEALIRAKEEWETTFNSVPHLISIIDDQHRIIRVNKAMAEKLGISQAEVAGLTCQEIFHGTERPPAFCPHSGLLDDGLEHTVEIYEPRWDQHFLVTLTPLNDSRGRTVHIARDITQIKRAERTLKISNAFLVISNRQEDLPGLVQAFLEEIKLLTRCGAVAIRIVGEEGQGIYELSDGFEYPLSVIDDWLSLLVYRHSNAAGNGDDGDSETLLAHRDLIFHNEAGALAKPVAAQTERNPEQDVQTVAYESIARVSIRSRGCLLGFIYAADKRKAMISEDHAELLQKVAMYLGTAVEKALAQDSLKLARQELEKRVEARTRALSIAKEQLEAEIAERAKIAEELRRDSAFREAVILNAREGLAVWRLIEEFPYVRFTVWNRSMEKITGYTMEEINRLGWAQTTQDDPAMQALTLEGMRKTLAFDDHSRLEKSIRRADGQWRDIIISSSPVRPPGEQAYVIILIYDFTELKKAEKELRQSEEQFRGLVENIRAGILIVRDGLIVYRNPEYARLLDSSVSDSDRLRDLAGSVHAGDRSLFETLTKPPPSSGATPLEVILRLVSPHAGKMFITRWVCCRSSQIQYQGRTATLIHMMDITELKKLERLVMLREKMASLGHVAAGIAHEIRNPLSGINVYLDAIRDCYNDPEYSQDVSKLVEEAHGASNRIESVIRRVLDFSRPSEMEMRPTTINDTIREALKLVAATLRKGSIALELDLDAGLPQLFADSQLIEQMILNLVTNASEALKGVGGPRLIRVSTRKENDHVAIRVEDSGPGIAEEMREQVFEPFFTTRGQGMGIGLIICKRIAADHRGDITISTSPLGGAQFNIMIPVEKRKRSR